MKAPTVSVSVAFVVGVLFGVAGLGLSVRGWHPAHEEAAVEVDLGYDWSSTTWGEGSTVEWLADDCGEGWKRAPGLSFYEPLPCIPEDELTVDEILDRLEITP